MIKLTPPYHLITTTLDMEMNAKQRRILRRKKERELNEIEHLANEAERIKADPELTNNKAAWLIACGLFLSLIGGLIAAWY